MVMFSVCMTERKYTCNITNNQKCLYLYYQSWVNVCQNGSKHKFHWKGTEPFYLDQLKNLKLSGIQKAKADQVKSNFWK